MQLFSAAQSPLECLAFISQSPQQGQAKETAGADDANAAAPPTTDRSLRLSLPAGPKKSGSWSTSDYSGISSPVV